MLPSVQLYENTSTKVQIFWDLASSAVASFNVYWSATGIVGSYVLLRSGIPNFGTFGKKYTNYAFLRADLSLTEKDSFYVAISSMDALGAESSMGTGRLVPYLADQMADAGSINSPITVSENLSKSIGLVPERITFTHDVKFLEIFNNSDNLLYVEVTGFDASVTKSIPVYPRVYYTIFRNLSKQTGVSIVAEGGVVDTRIVAHY